MADLIDRQAALDMAFEDGEFKGLVSEWDLHILPAVDAVEVVRCRDCFYSETVCGFMGPGLYCNYWQRDTVDDGYCHKGG